MGQEQPAASPPLSPTIKAIIGEAAGEGLPGMVRVGRVIQTRARQWGMTPDAVVQQPHQFSAMSRPDLDAFIARQGPVIQRQAEQAWNQAQGEPQPYATHYLTTQLMQSPQRPSWADRMEVVEQSGNHVFLRARARRR